MTRSQSRTSPADTDLRSGDSAAATGGCDDTKTQAEECDSDTKHGTSPKGSGLGGESNPGLQQSDDGGCSDTGGGGGPKTGLGATPGRQLRNASDPPPDPKDPPKTGLGGKPID